MVLSFLYLAFTKILWVPKISFGGVTRVVAHLVASTRMWKIKTYSVEMGPQAKSVRRPVHLPEQQVLSIAHQPTNHHHHQPTTGGSQVAHQPLDRAAGDPDALPVEPAS